MTVYSTSEEIDDVIAQAGSNPFFVYDLDGNSLHGYEVVPENSHLIDGLLPEDNPEQRLPFGTPPEKIAEWVARGALKETLFAAKPMDVRMDPRAVAVFNRSIARNEPFRIAYLSSRGAEAALTILKESGVERPELATGVADTGAILRLRGEEIHLRQLSNGEKNFPRRSCGAARRIPGDCKRHPGCGRLRLRPLPAHPGRD